MARPYTEQQVLKKLDIPDFRHMLDVGLTSSQLAALVKDPVLEILEDGLTDYRYSIRYGELIALNTHMIQKLYQMVEELLQQKEG